MPEKVIVRLPPSPTGHLHLGTLRTLLVNYIFAKKNNGEIVFRWEDTDKERSKKEFETEIESGLKWLGISWDRQNRQSENFAKHRETLEGLWEKGKIFPCFESAESVDAKRNTAEKNRENFVYWSPDRDLNQEEQREKIEKNEPHVWRWKTPQSETIHFDDLVKGTIQIQTETIGDFVIARADKNPLYLMANVLDDYHDGITHIIRGEDHISNTPKQILIFREISSATPHYAHLPLVFNHESKKLSKRNVEKGVCVLISDFQKAGFFPEAIVNGIMFLGWNPKNNREIFTKDELVEIFETTQLNSSNAKYDYDKMQWLNAEWAKKLEPTKMLEDFEIWLDRWSDWDDEIKSAFLDHSKKSKILMLGIEKSKIFAKILPEIDFLLRDFEIKNIPENPKKKTEKTTQEILQTVCKMLEKIEEKDFVSENIKQICIETIAEENMSTGDFLWPFRYGLSGREKSLGPFDICEVLGKDKAIQRLKNLME